VERIAVIGGIGSGKSAVTDLLARRGFAVVDADAVARDVVEPGRPAHRALVDAFGSAVLDEGGRIDRPFLAEVVFHDPTALRRLNAITHPRIGVEMAERLAAASGEAVFVAIPLFRPEHRALLNLGEVWAVTCDREVAVARLVEHRGFREADARARLEAQDDDEARQRLADRVIENDGSLVDLARRVDAALASAGLRG
jgi:dephospho-CoA kinase